MKKYTVVKSFTFEAAHSLPHLPIGHKCRNVHGHSYRLLVEVAGPLDSRGFVIDYAEIVSAVNPIVAQLDHKNLNDVFQFPTTAENIASWLFDSVRRIIGCSRVTLWETPTSFVIVEEQ